MNPNLNPASVGDLLHALADGQLDTAQSREMLELLEHNKVLQKEMCEIQRIKHLVKSAYPLPDSNKSSYRSRQTHWRQAAVYLLAFSLTFAAGAGSYYLMQPLPAEGMAMPGVAAKDNRFIVFVDSHEPAKQEKALDKAEQLAARVEGSGGSVYVVTSAEGIDLLRVGTTAHEGRILQMSHKYPHLRFVACSNTLYSFKQRGEMVELVDETEVAPSAVEFVVQHMSEGWRYVAI
jgi:hypothetical protein